LDGRIPIMMDGVLVGRARQVWTELAGVPVAFPAAGIAVVTSERSLLCPPGWAGIVVLGNAGIATVPADGVGAALADLPIAAATDVEQVRARLAPADTLGPATLAYLERPDFVPAQRTTTVETLPAGHAEIAGLMAGVSTEDAGECGLDEITSPAFVVREGAEVVAAAGYLRWPASVAHLGVLTGDRHRGRGLAGVVASAAVAPGLDDGLLPQWRARPPASRRVARRLGFRELGAQLSLRLAA
jgi:hypothetical protein